MNITATSAKLFKFFTSKYPKAGLSQNDIDKIVSGYFANNRPSDNSIHALIKIIEGRISTNTPKSSYMGFPNQIPNQPIHSLNPKQQSTIPGIDNLLPPPIVQPPKETIQMPNYNELLMQQNPGLVPKSPAPAATLPPPIETRSSKPKQIPQLPSYQTKMQQDPPQNLNIGFSTGIDDIDLEDFQEQSLEPQIQPSTLQIQQQPAQQMQIQQQPAQQMQIQQQPAQQMQIQQQLAQQMQIPLPVVKPQAMQIQPPQIQQLEQSPPPTIKFPKPSLVVIDSKERNMDLHTNPSFFVVNLVAKEGIHRGAIYGNWSAIKSSQLGGLVILDTEELHPYLILKIKELGEDTYYAGSSTLSSAYAVLTQYSTIGKYRYYSCADTIHEYDEPLNLTQLTIELLTPDGAYYNFGEENKNSKNTVVKFELKFTY
jgi:hypothetical protein